MKKIYFKVQFGNDEFEIRAANPLVLLLTIKEKFGYDVPDANKLLNHLFVKGVAYCAGSYTVTVVTE